MAKKLPPYPCFWDGIPASTVLLLGEPKLPTPKPNPARQSTNTQRGVLAEKNPMAPKDNAIKRKDTVRIGREPKRSDMVPAIGAMTTMTRGCTVMIKPEKAVERDLTSSR